MMPKNLSVGITRHRRLGDIPVLHRDILTVDYLPSPEYPACTQLPLGADLSGELTIGACTRGRAGLDIQDERRPCTLELLLDDRDLLRLVMVKIPTDRLTRTAFFRYFSDPRIVDTLVDKFVGELGRIAR